MQTTRQQKYSRLIQKEIGDIFQKEGRHFLGNAFVTITGVEISPDLLIAKIYFSIFDKKQSEYLFETLHTYKKEIRMLLANRIRKQVKSIPDLYFHKDDALEEADKIEKLLKSLNIPGKDAQ